MTPTQNLLRPPSLAQVHGYLARGEPAETYEKGLKERVTLLEWDSLEDAMALYKSSAYLAALEKLGGTVDRDIRIIPAIDPRSLE